MRLFVILLLAGCATQPPAGAIVVDQVCYTKAENAKLHETMEEQSDTIDKLHAQIRIDRRKNEVWQTRNMQLKGYCS